MSLDLFILIIGLLMMLNVVWMLTALLKGRIGMVIVSVLIHFLTVFGPLFYIILNK